jgi:hypothetical protein
VHAVDWDNASAHMLTIRSVTTMMTSPHTVGVHAVDWDNASAPMLKTAPTIKHYISYDIECTSGSSDGSTGPSTSLFGCAAPGKLLVFEQNVALEDGIGSRIC